MAFGDDMRGVGVAHGSLRGLRMRHMRAYGNITSDVMHLGHFGKPRYHNVRHHVRRRTEPFTCAQHLHRHTKTRTQTHGCTLLQFVVVELYPQLRGHRCVGNARALGPMGAMHGTGSAIGGWAAFNIDRAP